MDLLGSEGARTPVTTPEFAKPEQSNYSSLVRSSRWEGQGRNETVIIEHPSIPTPVPIPALKLPPHFGAFRPPSYLTPHKVINNWAPRFAVSKIRYSQTEEDLCAPWIALGPESAIARGGESHPTPGHPRHSTISPDAPSYFLTASNVTRE